MIFHHHFSLVDWTQQMYLLENEFISTSLVDGIA